MYLKIVAALLAIAVMAGCNTMAGAGKDVQSKDVQSIDTSVTSPAGENSAEKDGLPCGLHRLQPAHRDFPKGSRQRACV
jgi:predicted small secreted protein